MTTDVTPPRTPRVLVADDDPVIRMLICEALSVIGFTVEEAEDGNEAMRRIDESPPDLHPRLLVPPRGSQGLDEILEILRVFLGIGLVPTIDFDDPPDPLTR